MPYTRDSRWRLAVPSTGTMSSNICRSTASPSICCFWCRWSHLVYRFVLLPSHVSWSWSPQLVKFCCFFFFVYLQTYRLFGGKVLGGQRHCTKSDDLEPVANPLLGRGSILVISVAIMVTDLQSSHPLLRPKNLMKNLVLLSAINNGSITLTVAETNTDKKWVI